MLAEIKRKKTTILVLFDRAEGCCRRAWQGIERYRKVTPDLELLMANPGAARIRNWLPDAAIHIAPVIRSGEIEGIHELGLEIPVATVAFHGNVGTDVVVNVGFDQREVGCTAARHLLERGLRSFAYMELWDLISGTDPSKSEAALQRERGFNEELREHGFEAMRFAEHVQMHEDWETIVSWLRKLPPRTGIFLFDDSHGPWMHRLCSDAGRRIPEDLAFVSVGNDEIFCGGSHPPMSSVILPAEAMGETAIRSVHEKLLKGDRSSTQISLPLGGVEVRASSDVLAVENPALRRALEYIRENSDGIIRVNELAAEVGLNRRSLERLFQTYLDRSPLQHIHQIRINRAMELMQEGLSPSRVSEQLGFKTLAHFSRMFRSVTGQNPRNYMRST